MPGSSALLQQSPDNTHESLEYKRKDTIITRLTELYLPGRWKPPALRGYILTFTIAVCWALIGVLQFLLSKSQKDGGVIFAPKISELPLRESFLYLYFPTILAVIFSIFWTWIDVETKRMEPYYQLSKPNGALGKDSLLLEYPFEFIPLVPIKALRDRHWPVFWASFAVVLVTLGLVPTQAGIFSVKTVSQSTNIQFTVSASTMAVSDQAEQLSFLYAQSTYGIVTLNETLPPFMARNYTLRPFRLPDEAEIQGKTSQNGTWKAATTMYFADLYCQDVSHKSDNSTQIVYTSDRGCKFTIGLNGNTTMNKTSDPSRGLPPIKEFTGMYVGYENGGLADYSLDWSCKTTANRTFFAAFTRNKKRVEDPPNDVTAVFCNSRYWQQEVEATVDMQTKRPIRAEPLSDKQAIPWNLFNITIFETLLNAAALEREVRADVLPTKFTPKYAGSMIDTELSAGDSAPMQPMVALAALVGGQPLEAYLDWQKLSKSYADAYRLMFSRAMVEVLADKRMPSPQVTGKQNIITEAVVLEPVFVYIVEGLLGIISVSTIFLLYLSLTTQRNLCTDPGTIASVMSLVADSEMLLADFQKLDCCTSDVVRQSIANKRYCLADDSAAPSIMEISGSVSGPNCDTTAPPTPNHENGIAKPVRPYEFSLWVGFSLTTLFLALAIGLLFVFLKARSQGLPLPSSNTIVQNILSNYIPTVLATLIEPIWILINRLLCMLQPIEELQDCTARAKKSIDLGYSSLPPQLVLFKAIFAKHFVLATVCVMALLANLLAVAFAGIFLQDTINISYATYFKAPLALKFVSINGSIGPSDSDSTGVYSSGAYVGGDGLDQFLAADSNITRGTPLPAWTDDRFFYLPFTTNSSDSNTQAFEAVTHAFGADLDCSDLNVGSAVPADIRPYRNDPATNAFSLSMNFTVKKGSSNFECSLSSEGVYLTRGPIGQGCSKGPSAAEIAAIVGPRRVNASRPELDACMENVVLGWLRTNNDCGPIQRQPLSRQNATFILCKPRLWTGKAQIRVDSGGRLLDRAKDVGVKVMSDTDNASHFTNGVANFRGQSNRFLFQGRRPIWHNDTFTDEYINYFMRHRSNSSRLLDPIQQPPAFEDIMGPLNKAYPGLFAIWLATNKDRLLFAQNDTAESRPNGWRLENETRLFVSPAMFIISEAILGTYAVVTLLVYMRRPGRYLPRLPTSIAAMIALFAASSAVRDMKDTGQLNKKERAQYLERLDARYGYGSYIGPADGRVHVGIEKTPFVRRRPKLSWLEARKLAFRNSPSEA